MSKLDPQLEIILAAERSALVSLAQGNVIGLQVEGQQDPIVSIIVQHQGTVAQLQQAGMTVETSVSDVVTGTIPVSRIGDLADLDSVTRVEAASAATYQLDVSRPEINADDVHNLPAEGTPPARWRGNGVIIGIVDTGIDYTHPAFRDDSGRTRILRIWDQFMAPTGTEHNPTGKSYGVEYTQADIDSALTDANPLSIVRHQDRDTVTGHGTHVAGIAAGNGRTGGTFIGMAPEASIIAVCALGGPASSLPATTNNLVDAADYVFEVARQLGRPAVVNFSLGTSSGPHDGTSITELGLDRLLGTPGRAVAIAAGNEGANGIHATGRVGAGASETVQFTTFATPPGGPAPVADRIEIWYSGQDRFDISLTEPSGNTVGPVTPGNTLIVNLNNNNRVLIRSQLGNPGNNANEILIVLLNGTVPTIQAGNWSFTITGTTVNDDGGFDAYVGNRNGRIPAFMGAHGDRLSSVMIPGTTREVVSVGSFITKNPPSGSSVGQISAFSGRGPTRDGRFKPDITAPGEQIMSARASNAAGAGSYHLLAGTSMATPAVAGSIALILQRYPSLTMRQILQGLTETARTDGNTGSEPNIPNHTWGYGKLDSLAAFNHTYTALRPRNWVRIRPVLYNWTLTDTPPSFEITADENGSAVIELAWDPQAMMNPSVYADPLRYYHSGEDFNHNITNANGSTQTINVPAQTINLNQGRAVWAVPQALWDGYREEALKSLATPPTSTFSRRLYYRVRYQPVGASEVMLWPPDASINDNPSAPSMGIIALRSAPASQVVPDQAAVNAMGGVPVVAPSLWSDMLMMYWRTLPESSADRQSLVNIFSHRFFTNFIETEVRGKILKLWLFAGRVRQRIPDMLSEQFRTQFGLENTVFKQTDLRNEGMLIDHLLAMTGMDFHSDMTGVLVGEQVIDDILSEITDPNGQNVFGTMGNVSITGLNAFMILQNAAEYVRLLKGLMSPAGQVRMANGDTLEIPEGIYRVQSETPPANPTFVARRFAELALLSAALKYALRNAYPDYDPSAAVYDPNGVGQAFFSAIRRGLTEAQLTRVLSALLGRNVRASNRGPSPAVRDAFRDALNQSQHPLLLTLWWGAQPGSSSGVGGHTVVALREDAGRIFFRNPLYAGTSPPVTAVANTATGNPPRRHEDPTEALESIGDADLGQWIMWYHS